MTNAINLFWYIFQKFNDLIFNQFQIQQNVTVGWIIIAAMIFGILITNILNIPNNIRFNKQYNGHLISSKKGTNTHG